MYALTLSKSDGRREGLIQPSHPKMVCGSLISARTKHSLDPPENVDAAVNYSARLLREVYYITYTNCKRPLFHFHTHTQ